MSVGETWAWTRVVHYWSSQFIEGHNGLALLVVLQRQTPVTAYLKREQLYVSRFAGEYDLS